MKNNKEKRLEELLNNIDIIDLYTDEGLLGEHYGLKCELIETEIDIDEMILRLAMISNLQTVTTEVICENLIRLRKKYEKIYLRVRELEDIMERLGIDYE